MKKNKLIILVSIVTALLIGVVSFSYAATEFKSPSEIIAGLTGKSVEDVTAARQAGNSFGEQAIEAGKLEEFQAAKLELFKQSLSQAVADKHLTQEEADTRYEAMKTHLEACDGTGSGIMGRGMGGGLNSGSGMMNRGKSGGLNGGSANCTGSTANP